MAKMELSHFIFVPMQISITYDLINKSQLIFLYINFYVYFSLENRFFKDILILCIHISHNTNILIILIEYQKAFKNHKFKYYHRNVQTRRTNIIRNNARWNKWCCPLNYFSVLCKALTTFNRTAWSNISMIPRKELPLK